MAWAIPIVAALISAGGTYAANKWGNKAGENEQVSNFTPGQQSALDQALKGFQGGGGIESALRYFQDLLSDNPDAMKAFEAPAMRQFNEQIIPNIAERFSGQGAGGQSSGAFQRALGQAGASLSEQLQAMRAGLQGGAANSLTSILTNLLGARGFENQYHQGGPNAFGAGVGAFSGAVGSALPELTKYAIAAQQNKPKPASENTPTQAAVA
jgi:hypothetical protein